MKISNEEAKFYFLKGLQDQVKLITHTSEEQSLEELTKAAIIGEEKIDSISDKGLVLVANLTILNPIKNYYNKRERLSDEEYNHRKINKLCLNCGQINHMAMHCSQRFANKKRFNENIQIKPNSSYPTYNGYIYLSLYNEGK